MAKAALAPYEVDGWMGNWKDAVNHHNIDRKSGTALVGFVRFVDTEE